MVAVFVVVDWRSECEGLVDAGWSRATNHMHAGSDHFRLRPTNISESFQVISLHIVPSSIQEEICFDSKYLRAIWH